MFLIQKIEIAYTKDVDPESFESDMLVASNYQPRIDYLSRIDADYWWNPDRKIAMAFITQKEAEDVAAAYRRHQGDHRSHIRIVRSHMAERRG